MVEHIIIFDESISLEKVELGIFNSIETKIVSVVIGEGGSGGALAISIGDKLAMMRYSVYSVISPEGCASILWKDQTMVETATNALKVTPQNLKDFDLIDDVIDEPLIGAHRDKESATKALGDYFLDTLSQLDKLSTEDRMEKRYERLMSLGSFA